jgi:ABC-type oligopeptide transport system ATPase subunit
MPEPRIDPNGPLLRVRGLRKVYRMRGGLPWRPPREVVAVDDVDLDVVAGRTLGLVGASGSGKSTIGRCVLRLVEPTAGTVELGGVDVLSLGRSELRRFRRHAQIIFQDPYSSLNPRLTVGAALEEPLRVHGVGDRSTRARRVRELLEMVGLRPSHADRYPHEFSGGQRQRIGIARALALEPRLIVADEPVSALDVSVQAQVLNLLAELQRELGLSMLFIAHDLAVVEHVSHEVAVLDAGRVVERGSVEEVIARPQHEVTRRLRNALPDGALGSRFGS